jgi:cardiolipin synthase
MRIQPIMTAPRTRTHPATLALATVGAASLVLMAARFATNFLGSPRPLRLNRSPGVPLDSPTFLQFLSTVTDGAVLPARITRLRDGAHFFPAMLAAIRNAQRAINLEFYEFLDGRITREFLAALQAAAARGVEVRILVDAIGSASLPDATFQPLRAAGGHMVWYHALLSRTWPAFNNRTHRKLLVVDGTIGFLGGAGIADQWLYSTPTTPAWRDTMFQVQGQAVLGLVATFAQNWVEASAEILAGPEQFPIQQHDPHGHPSFMVLSTPRDGATRSHVLFQALIQSAQRAIRITTPYFLPDRSDRTALEEARKRGVDIQILVAGPRIDHPFIRRMTRNSASHLLRAGARMFEYQPSMIHAKTMTIDGLWSVIGSTNFDHRSFALNDEVNLATLDPHLAKTLDQDFADDLRQSTELSLATLPTATPIEDVFDAIAEQQS